MAEEKEKPLTREDVLRFIKENGEKAEGLDLSGKWFEQGIDLREFDLKGIILEEAVFKRTSRQALIKTGIRLGVGDFSAENDKIGALLSGAHLEGASLSHAHLENAILCKARLENASLDDTHLEKSNLIGAHLESSHSPTIHLQGAMLVHAHLESARLFDAHLEEADLRRAYLRKAYLPDAHLEGAFLLEAKFSPDTELEDVNWGNYKLGEENEKDFHSAENIYRRLKQWYTNAGMYDIAAKFYYREKEANRKALRLRSKDWHNRLAAEFMRVLFGYGERWERILIWMAVVIFGLAGAYYFWGLFSSSSFWDTLYYSAASFTALGYGRWAPQPSGWAKAMGAAEAFIGVSMMALLLVTFVRKWTR